MREGVHCNVVKWAREAGKFVRIDRKGKWGNSFKAGKDGTRKEVIAKYERYLLEERQDLLERLPELKGKVLGCWCAPEPCHGDVLLRLAEEY